MKPHGGEIESNMEPIEISELNESKSRKVKNTQIQ
jgi:hypothetical protein